MIPPPPPLSSSLAPSLHGARLTIVCLLGCFQLFSGGEPVPLRSGGKTESILWYLALRFPRLVPRATLLASVWPDTEPGLAAQALNSVIYSLHKQLGRAENGLPSVVYADGGYGLNPEADVGVDSVWFDTLVQEGERQTREGDRDGAISTFSQALEIYRGDLVGPTDIYAVVERERLRAQYLTLLSRIADHAFQASEYSTCLSYVQRLLAGDPCREDAHRMAMRCYVRLGERSQALRQYAVCAEMLQHEFDVAPEPSTSVLYRQIRLDPSSV